LVPFLRRILKGLIIGNSGFLQREVHFKEFQPNYLLLHLKGWPIIPRPQVFPIRLIGSLFWPSGIRWA